MGSTASPFSGTGAQQGQEAGQLAAGRQKGLALPAWRWFPGCLCEAAAPGIMASARLSQVLGGVLSPSHRGAPTTQAQAPVLKARVALGPCILAPHSCACRRGGHLFPGERPFRGIYCLCLSPPRCFFRELLCTHKVREAHSEPHVPSTGHKAASFWLFFCPPQHPSILRHIPGTYISLLVETPALPDSFSKL